MSEALRILTAIDNGDRQAAEQLFPLVIDELRRLAARKLAHESPGPTPAALGITVYLARQNWTDARACLGDVLGG
jgi:hypothetical protein